MPAAPIRNPNYPWLARDAGTAIEPSTVAQWAALLRRRGWQVVPRQQLGTHPLLGRIFPERPRNIPHQPDLVALHPRRRIALVGDVTSQPTPAHLRATSNHARRLAAGIPGGWPVFAQEWYWGLPPDYPRWGRLPVSPRFPVNPPAARATAGARARRAAWARALLAVLPDPPDFPRRR